MDFSLTFLVVLATVVVGVLWSAQAQQKLDDVVKYVRVAFFLSLVFLVTFISKFWQYLFIWWLIKK